MSKLTCNAKVVVVQLEDKFMHEKRRPSDVPADAVKTLHSHSYHYWTISQEVSSIAVLSTPLGALMHTDYRYRCRHGLMFEGKIWLL